MEFNKIENRKHIGSRIAEIRKQQKITTAQLAESTGLKQNNISRIELGKYSTDVDLLGTIAAALNYKIDLIENK